MAILADNIWRRLGEGAKMTNMTLEFIEAVTRNE